MSLPIMKLGTLLAKTISKPVGKALQKSAKTHPALRSFCVVLGNQLHKLKFRVNQALTHEFHIKKVPSPSPAPGPIRPPTRTPPPPRARAVTSCVHSVPPPPPS